MAEQLTLNYQYFGGEGHSPMVILHGLLGSSRNWTTVARELAKEFEVFALDLRNHGQSPHASEMDYLALAGDVLAFLDANQLEMVTLLGHSMGGKTAMRLAVDHPNRVETLIVADISPKPYAAHHRIEMGAMQAMPLDLLKSRKEAETHLERFGVDEWAHRQFLLTNLVRDAETKAFKWQINVPGIDRNMEHVALSPLAENERYEGPTLFIRGEKSKFMTDADTATIQSHFPYSRVTQVSDAGHNVHVENKAGFLEAVASLKYTDWGCEV